jgi:hypothetical protein
MTGQPIANKAWRGDVAVVHVPASYDVLGKGRTVTEGYRVGIVTSVARDGWAKSIDTGCGDIDPRGHRCTIRMCQVAWLQPRETVDMAGLRAWLASDDNAQPQPTLDAARDVVRRFLR